VTGFDIDKDDMDKEEVKSLTGLTDEQPAQLDDQ